MQIIKFSPLLMWLFLAQVVLFTNEILLLLLFIVISTQERQAAMRHRKITFEGKFEPVKWACRAPLPSGKLCPRKDRVKV